MKALTFESLQKLMKSFGNKFRNYSNCFLVDENKRIVYTDGYFIMIVSVCHSFDPGVYSVTTGAPSQVQYPNYQGIGIGSFERQHVANKLLHVADKIKPTSKKAVVIVGKDGQIDPEDGAGFNLKYLNVAVELGMTEFHVDKGGLGKAFKENVTTEFYLVETAKKE